jgi:hypothetical protein
MKAKTKFIKMFYKLPEKARKELVLNAYGDNPMSLNVVCMEVRYDTELGKRCLAELGYKDEVRDK